MQNLQPSTHHKQRYSTSLYNVSPLPPAVEEFPPELCPGSRLCGRRQVLVPEVSVGNITVDVLAHAELLHPAQPRARGGGGRGRGHARPRHGQLGVRLPAPAQEVDPGGALLPENLHRQQDDLLVLRVVDTDRSQVLQLDPLDGLQIVVAVVKEVVAVLLHTEEPQPGAHDVVLLHRHPGLHHRILALDTLVVVVVVVVSVVVAVVKSED